MSERDRATTDRTRSGLDRRGFLKTSAATALGLSATFAFPAHRAYAGGSATLRVGMIGCGGRGTGAADNCVESSDGVVIAAMGDLFEDRLDRSRGILAERLGDRFQVDDDHAFVGWDAYRRVLETDVDVVILATPPHFRPMQLRAAIEAGKHVFMEKPVAVDPTGVRSVIASAEEAARRGLAIVAGTQRRHDPQYVETMRRIHDGAIGEIVSGQVYWNQGGLWNFERGPGMSDMEWQVRNWLYFTWLSGDHMVEQHIHNLDVANWALGGPPVRANGVGGRQVRVDPSYGHIFDHFAIELEYPNGARVLSMCRQQDGTSRFVGERFAGTAGTSDGRSSIRGRDGGEWRYEAAGEDVNPYVREHTDLIAGIRAGRPLNEGRRVAESTLTAIMAREAAYTGREITWDQIRQAELDLSPGEYEFGPVPFPPVPQPGVTELSRPFDDHAWPAPAPTDAPTAAARPTGAATGTPER